MKKFWMGLGVGIFLLGCEGQETCLLPLALTNDPPLQNPYLVDNFFGAKMLHHPDEGYECLDLEASKYIDTYAESLTLTGAIQDDLAGIGLHYTGDGCTQSASGILQIISPDDIQVIDINGFVFDDKVWIREDLLPFGFPNDDDFQSKGC